VKPFEPPAALEAQRHRGKAKDEKSVKTFFNRINRICRMNRISKSTLPTGIAFLICVHL
jgi:hypothetical protein